jgi:hypothetical protein
LVRAKALIFVYPLTPALRPGLKKQKRKGFSPELPDE